MKKVALIMIPALICGMVFTSCNTEKPESDEKTTDRLYVVGAKSTTKSTTKSATVPKDKTDLVFTGDDIVSFEVLSGQIIFTDKKFDDIMSRISLHNVLYFFIDDKPVFDPPIQIHYGWDVSVDDFDLQFRTDGQYIHLTEWYMLVDSLPVADREIQRAEMEANIKHRKKELDVFIEYLDKAGKIVRSDVLPPYLEPAVNDTVKACGYSLPHENLPWLKNLIDLSKTDKTGHYFGRIWLENYKGQDIFVTNMMLGSGGVMYWYFDCSGNHFISGNWGYETCPACQYVGNHHVIIDDEEEFQSFRSNMKLDVLIYSSI